MDLLLLLYRRWINYCQLAGSTTKAGSTCRDAGFAGCYKKNCIWWFDYKILQTDVLLTWKVNLQKKPQGNITITEKIRNEGIGYGEDDDEDDDNANDENQMPFRLDGLNLNHNVPTKSAVRENLKKYFTSPAGSVHWQFSKI